jgi:hypothetical protein
MPSNPDGRQDRLLAKTRFLIKIEALVFRFLTPAFCRALILTNSYSRRVSGRPVCATLTVKVALICKLSLRKFASLKNWLFTIAWQ